MAPTTTRIDTGQHIKEMLMRRFPPFTLTFLALLAGLGACGDSTSPGDTSKPPGQLTVVRLAPSSLPLFNSPDSFYAVKGEDREVRIYFKDPGTNQAGEEFLRLRVRPGSLLSRPGGSPFAAGDSVLITVRIVDPSKILFEMEPSGLSFDPAEPAELKIHYNHADHDFNEDGVINAFDATIKSKLAIWRQELLTDPFVRIGSVNAEGLEEINADILGFTRYAIAY
ncbi:MAG TPA: hypothetical protein VGC48_03465 [Gemmatimonadales bacterium]